MRSLHLEVPLQVSDHFAAWVIRVYIFQILIDLQLANRRQSVNVHLERHVSVSS